MACFKFKIVKIETFFHNDFSQGYFFGQKFQLESSKLLITHEMLVGHTFVIVQKLIK